MVLILLRHVEKKRENAMTLFEELKWRGLIDNVTSPELEDKINHGALTFYIGTDPTGDSLHIGHFSSLLTAKRLKEHGHHPIMLVGGATGFIGDPKPTTERAMLTKETLEHNYQCLSKQIKALFGFEMVNNLDWTKEINVIDFLRDYGKFFNINYMLNKETVKRRLDIGITYTEFSYMILQALDFLHLYETKGCTLQIGGQDQWGNITSGLELIRKKHGVDVECYGFTMPLVTKADGTKFGKSETGTVWLDKEKTSAYELYQFFLNSEDEKVIDYLKRFTFLSKEEIEALEVSVKDEPEQRLAQKTLAKEVVVFLHGEAEYQNALRITEALFQGAIKELSLKEIMNAFKDVPSFHLSEPLDIVDLLVTYQIASSKREARELVMGNSISINGEKVTDIHFIIDQTVALHGKAVIIKRGKKKNYVGLFDELKK